MATEGAGWDVGVVAQVRLHPFSSRAVQRSDGRPHGRFAEWDASGWLRQETSLRDGLEHGERYAWHEDGELESIGQVVDGVLRGRRVEFDPSGAKTRESVLIGDHGPSAEFLGDLSRLQTRN